MRIFYALTTKPTKTKDIITLVKCMA